jgi:hypothetical protein
MPAMCHSHPAATALLHRAPSGITHAEVPIWRAATRCSGVVRCRRYGAPPNGMHIEDALGPVRPRDIGLRKRRTFGSGSVITGWSGSPLSPAEMGDRSFLRDVGPA